MTAHGLRAERRLRGSKRVQSRSGRAARVEQRQHRPQAPRPHCDREDQASPTSPHLKLIFPPLLPLFVHV